MPMKRKEKSVFIQRTPYEKWAYVRWLFKGTVYYLFVAYEDNRWLLFSWGATEMTVENKKNFWYDKEATHVTIFQIQAFQRSV